MSRNGALGCSLLALAAASASPASASCTPDPTLQNGTTICTGSDADGFVVSSSGTTVRVDAGAQLFAGLDAAVSASQNVTLRVDGSVVGGSQPGILLGNGAPFYGPFDPYAGAAPRPRPWPTSVLYYPGGGGWIAVGETGIVSGTAAIRLQKRSDNASGLISVDVQNSGQLLGTAGPALVGEANTSFNVSNTTGGMIGGISGHLNGLRNFGTIDGGSLSAISSVETSFLNNYLFNAGTIRSASAAATMDLIARSVGNEGRIENSGSGAAIASRGNLIVENRTGGQILSARGTAILAMGSIYLENAGSIVGSVISSASASNTSFVNTSAGTIQGDLRLGAGNDTLVDRFDVATGRSAAVTGNIDGGGGIDTLGIIFSADATLGRSNLLPADFEQLSLAPDASVTATLAEDFVAPGAISIGGSGTVVNRTTLSGAAQAVLRADYYSGSPTFINAGTVQTTAGRSGVYAVELSSYSSFENSGTISATGDGVSFSSQGAFVNTGTITAAATGVSLFGWNFDNSGTILSTGGTAVSLSGSSGSGWTNTGRIEGATAGVNLFGSLENRGTITSPGIGVKLNAYGVLDNRAGGVVTGGIGAVVGTSPLFNANVANAGVINGDVSLPGNASGSYNGNRYFALAGGILNGNLTLGRYDTLVAELVNTGSGAIAGISGTVTGSGSLLRYRVRGDASATLGVPAGFAEVGYDLYDDAALTLTGSSTLPLTLAGMGSVDVTANITSGGEPAIMGTSVLVAPGETWSPTNALSITSRGTLLLDHADNATYSYAAVAIGSNDSFTNAGTIAVRDRAIPIYNQISAIVGGKSITNTGMITLDGANGILGAQTLTNSGSILQAAGGRAATGVRNVGTLTNSGTIDVAGTAVLVDYNSQTIINSGRIASSGLAAIDIAPYGSSYGLTITNLAGGTIAGGVGQPAIRLSSGTVDNAGTIIGTVDLGYSSYGRSYSGATYLANGGTIAGDLIFGDGSDRLIALNDITGVSGRIDGGDGEDIFIHARDSSGAVALGLPLPTNFELEGVRSLGSGTVLNVSAAAPVKSDFYVSGDGQIVNTAMIQGAVWTDSPSYSPGEASDEPVLASFTNIGSMIGGFYGTADSFTNSGTIGAVSLAGDAAVITGVNGLIFANSGQIANYRAEAAVQLSALRGTLAATNSGSIDGGLRALGSSYYMYPSEGDAAVPVSLVNSGSITSIETTVSLESYDAMNKGALISLANSGSIEANGTAGTGAVLRVASFGYPAAPASLNVSNSGILRANGGGEEYLYYDWWADRIYRYTAPATALSLSAAAGTATVANGVMGLIEATGVRSSAIAAEGVALDLANAGAIRGGAGTVLSNDSELPYFIGSTYLAGAIHTAGNADDRILNTGSIIGSIALGAGNDRIENRGRIEGDVFLGAGDDIFLQQATAALIGTVDGGEGSDGLVVDAAGGGAVNGDQFVDFERFSQVGEGNVTYSGTFRLNTIDVSGGTLTVSASQTLTSDGPVTVTGSDAAETVVNNGTIGGSVELAAGNDRLINNGVIRGSVALGSGDDQFVEGVGSRIAAAVDGGEGSDFYSVILAGDRSGIGQRSGFERLGVEGSGTLSLALDQDFSTVSLAGTGLALSLAGYRVGAVTGSDAAETLTLDGDIANGFLGGGDDRLILGGTRVAGHYDGGAGNDLLRFTSPGSVTLAGSATLFEQVELASGALTVSGTLGSAGAPLSFGAGYQQLTLVNGGTLAGLIDLGAGNDAFHLLAGGIVSGNVSGGAGTDSFTIELAGNRTVGSEVSGFETLISLGEGLLSLTGGHVYDQVTAAGDLAVLAGASLTTPQVQFGAATNQLTISGAFAGSVDGGAGQDRILVSGGSATAPVAFRDIANVESFGMSSGYATISGSAALGSLDLTGGRLVGLGGSSIGASQILVRQNATFGSAGTVNATITVGGMLSPGASPGTMTVNGNVALQSGSVSLFELTPTVSDKLVVNGLVSIAPGATLQIVPTGTLRPGTSYDLITASGGITGSYSTVVKPDSLFGFLVQRTDRIQLLGQFLNDAAFTPQVSASIAYANATLVAQPATSTLFDAVPALLTSSGASNPLGFAQLTPEAYASASQIGVDNALTLAGVTRGGAFATTGKEVQAYTFAQTLGGWHRLGGDPDIGTSAVRSRSYGFLGGLGVGDKSWSIAAFAGYLNNRQRIDALGAGTEADGLVAGVHGRYLADDGFGITASILYDGGDATTRRALPGGGAATGRYDLRSWVSDLSVSYGLSVNSDWSLRPRAGLTYVRTTRNGVSETGGSPFALAVARDRHVAGFADVGLSFGRSEASEASFRPFVSLGARYQIEGQRIDAQAGYAGGGFGLEALGAQRARMVGTAAAGANYRLPSGLELFGSATSQSGNDDHQETITAGVRLRF